MSPRQLMRLWEIRHGKLSAEQQQDFLSHPDIPSIIIFSPTSVIQHLKENPKLDDLRTALEVHGVIAGRKRPRAVSGPSSILKKPRPHRSPNLPLADKDLPKPNREPKKTPPKRRGKDAQLRKIAQRYRWWE